MTEFRQARLALAMRYAALTAALLTAVSTLVWFGVRSLELAQRDDALEREGEWLVGFLATGPPPEEIAEELGEVEVGAEERTGLAIVDQGGQPVYRYGILDDADEGWVRASAGGPPGPRSAVLAGRGHVRTLITGLGDGRRAVVASALTGFDAHLRRLAIALLLTDLVGVALTPLLGWRFAGTALRPAQRSYQRMRQFLADASHEMRTPLTAIIGEAEVTLRRDRSPEEYRQSMAYCVEYARQMSQVVEDVLELSRADAGVPILRVEPLDLAALAREEAASAQRLAGEARSIAYAGPEGPVTIEGDARLLRRVVRNLLDNALRHAPSATSIEVALEGDGARGEVRVSVADNGEGIGPEHLPRLFERFYTGPGTDARRGSGLGLAIVDAVVSAHGGRVDVSTEVGKGSRFTVRLPVAVPGHQSSVDP
jgi:signal transduction histidine kinase